MIWNGEGIAVFIGSNGLVLQAKGGVVSRGGGGGDS